MTGWTHATLRRIAWPCAAIAVSSAFPRVARAEPGASTAHVPLLWAIAIAGALLVGSIPLWVWRVSKPRRVARPYWIAAATLALLFLIFVGPMIVAIGSMLLTGRTM